MSVYIYGTPGNDDLCYAGDEFTWKLQGQGGNDTLSGDEYGASETFASYSETTSGVLIDLSLGFASGIDCGVDLIYRIHNAEGGSGNDTIVGGGLSEGGETLIGNNGNDTLMAGQSYSFLSGGSGSDRLYDCGNHDTMLFGGPGNDTYYIEDGSGSQLIYDESGCDTVVASVNFTLGDGIEKLQLKPGVVYGEGNALNNTIKGSNCANVLIGADGSDWLYGYGGSDLIIGGNGSDKVFGGGNADIIEGGAGKDRLSGGKGNDVFLFQANDGFDTITDFRNGDSIKFTDYVGDITQTRLGEITTITYDGGVITIHGSEVIL